MDHKISRSSKQSITFRDMYKDFVKQTDTDISYELYKLILQDMCKVILEYLFEASEGFKMPYGLGYIQIVKYQPKTLSSKSLSVDYKSSKQYDKLIYHLNEHSDGYKYRLYWSKVPKTFIDRYKYQLCLVRANKRKLAQMIFNKHDYININDIQIYKM